MRTNLPPKSAFEGPDTIGSVSPDNSSNEGFEQVRNEISDKDGYVKICDPGTTDTRRQLRCFKLTSGLGKGGQAWTFRGRRDPDKENRDTICQAYKFARGQQLAENNGKGFTNIDNYFKKARREALEILSKKNGTKELKSRLEDILKQKSNVCIRVTEKIIDQNARQRIDREITAAGMSGPNIIPIYNLGTINGRFVFVMPLVKNASEPYGFGIDQILEGFSDVAKALAYMHDRGMIHRDVKPENMLFITSSNSEKVKGYLIDYGLMKIIGDEEKRGTLTNSSMIAGTIPFCSPEQAVALRKADGQSDIYSFGAALYQVLTWEDPNPIDPRKHFDIDEATMEYHRNLITKYRGDVGDRPTRPLNINRNVTLRELFGTSVRTPDHGSNRPDEITQEDIEDHNISFCSRLRRLYLRIRHNRKHHNLEEKLKHLELAVAAMLHPGERDQIPDIYTRYFRYTSMTQVIEDLDSIREGKKPVHAYEIVREKFKTTKRSAREKYIHQAFSDYCPYSERAVRGLSNPAWYTKAASFLGSAAAGGLLGTVADQYLHLGEKLQPIFNTVYEFLSTI